MYTIKEASSRSGVPVAPLGAGTAWSRPGTESGYRLYDDAAIAALSIMRRLVDSGWSPAAAATGDRLGPGDQRARTDLGRAATGILRDRAPEAATLTEAFSKPPRRSTWRPSSRRWTVASPSVRSRPSSTPG